MAEAIPELLNKDTQSNPSPVSPVSLLANGSFFSQEDTGFFNTPVLTKKPLGETKASMLGFATAVMSTEDPHEMAGISQETVNSLMTFGDAPLMEQVRQQIQADDEAAAVSSTWENHSFLSAAQLDPEGARQIQKDIDSELRALKFQDDSARLIAEAAAKLTPTQRKLAQDTSFITEEIMYQQSIEQVLSAKIASDEEKASFWNWAAMLNPLSPIASRKDQSKLVDIVSKNLGQDPSSYVFKSEHGEILQKYFLDPSLTMPQALERLNEAEELFNSIDYEKEGINPLWGSEFFSVMRSTLADQGQTATLGQIYDAMDAGFVTADAAALVKGLRKVGAGLSAKIYGKAAMSSNATTPEQAEEVLRQMEKSLKPNWNIEESGLLTPTPDAAPVGKAARVKEIEAEIQTLNMQASGTIPRAERKDLELQKQSIGSDISSIKSENTKELAKSFQAEGMKFKEALKLAEKDKANRLAAKQAELDQLQSDIDLVDSFSEAKAKVTRLEQEKAKLQGVVPIAKSKVSVSVSNAIRDRGSMLDTLAVQNPAAARSIISSVIEENPSNVRTLGVTEESLTERIIPNADDGLGVHAAALSNRTSLFQKFKEELDQLNPSDLLTAAEIKNVPSIWAKAVEQHSTGTLYSTHSDLVRVADSGDIVVRGVYGGSVDSGFSSLDSATKALTNIFDGQGVIKVRHVGSNESLIPYDEAVNIKGYFNTKAGLEFFVETEQTLRPDPSFASPFEKDWITPMIPGAPYLASVSRRIQKDIFDSISAWSDKATRIAGLQSRMLEPIGKLSGKDKDTWGELLLRGDQDETVYGSRKEAEAVLGKPVSQRVWDAYVGTRDYYDSVAEVRQRSVYKHLQMNGYRTLRNDKGEVVSDLNGLIHVRPIHAKPVIVERPVEGSNELFTPSNVWGKTIWDTRTGEAVELSHSLLEEVYSSGRVVARVGREAEFVNDALHEFVIIDASKASPLIRNPMNVRRGHVDFNYRGEDSLVSQLAGGYRGGNTFKVAIRGTKTVNGVAAERLTTVGLYANAKQARIARESMVQSELAKGTAPEQVALMFPEPELTREGLGELGLDTAGTFTGVPAHARKRGDVNIVTQGGKLAEMLDPAESLTRSIAETRRLLNVDAIEMMKKRFAQTYAKDMEGFNGFHSDFSRFVFKKNIPLERLGEAKRAHEAIENLDHALSNRQFVMFMDKLASYSQELMATDSAFKNFAGKVLNDFSKTKLDNEVKKVVATLLIAARPFYQILANSFQAAYLFAANPIIFAKTIRLSIASGLGIAGLKIDSRLMNAVGARLAGMEEADFIKHIDNMRKSGIIRSGFGQDISSLLVDGAKVEAGKHSLASSVFWKRNIPGLGGVERAGKLLMIPQHMATDFANFMAYNHAVMTAASKKPLAEVLSRRGQIEVAGDARRLTWNQNRTDQFTYQQNALSLQLMFFQHVHRMYMDLILDPMIRVGTLGKYGASRHGTNPYAKDFVTSVKTMGIMSALWGASAYPIIDDKGITSFGEEVGATPEAISYFTDGLIHKAVEDLYKEKFNVAARFSPAGAVESLFEMMFTNDGGLVVGGPVNHLTDTLSKMSKLSQVYWDSTPMDQQLVLELLRTTAGSVASGTNDVYKAWMVKNVEEYVDSSGRPIAHVMDTAWIPVLLSVQPEKVEQTYDLRSDVFERKDKAEEISKAVTRWAMEKYQENPNSQSTFTEIWIKGLQACKLYSGEDKELALMAQEQFMKLQFGSEELQAKLIDDIIKTHSSSEAKEKLTEMLKLNPDSDYLKLAIKTLGDLDGVQ